MKSRRIPNPEEGLYKALKMLASSEVRVIIGKENWAETMRRLRVPSTAPKTLSSPGKVIIINYIENKLKSSTYRTVPPTIKLDDSGDSLRLLQEHLGHASFNTTAKYRKIAGEEHRSWYDWLWHDFGKY